MFLYKSTANLLRVTCILRSFQSTSLYSSVAGRKSNRLSTCCLSLNYIALKQFTTAKGIILSVKMAATWSMGPGTLEVPLSLFAKNRRRLTERLQKGQVVVLQGGDDISHYDTDIHYVFRQVCITTL